MGKFYSCYYSYSYGRARVCACVRVYVRVCVCSGAGVGILQITSRTPNDLPDFCKAIIAQLKE